MSSHVIRLPFDTPPLTMNQARGGGGHWSVQAALKARVHRDVGIVAKHAKIPALRYPVAVNLVQIPKDRRVRDADGLGWTLKAVLDALVAAGVLTGDDSRYVRRTTCEITRSTPAGCMYVTIVELQEDR